MLTVGRILKQERERKGLTVQDIEKRTRVRSKFIQALENDTWDLFSSKIYIEGLIKNYANILDLNPEKLQAFFRREYEKKEEVGFKNKLSVKYLTPETKKYLYGFVIFAFIFFIFYFGVQIRQFLAPPKINILAPQEQTFKREKEVEIVGQTQKEAVITIFGSRVYQNNQGIFRYNLPLKPGKNELIINVEGANGKKTVFKKEYFLNP